jgi:ferredoxin--NADP+ reductase
MEPADRPDVADPELRRILQQVERRRLAHRRDAVAEVLRVGTPDPRARRGPLLGRRAAPHDRHLDGPPGQVLEIEQVGPSVRIFRVGRPPGLRFRAGQYVKVGVPGGRQGSFSLASAPHEAHVELCIELVPGGRLTPRLFSLAAGAPLELGTRAKGSFLLDRTGRTHLMVATVTGIAPLRSMLRAALHDGTSDSFVVLHGASHADELPYLEELRALAATDPRVRYVPTVSRPDDPRNVGWRGETGRVDALAVRVADSLDRVDTRAYACGNPGMVATVTRALRERGVSVTSEVFD